MGNIQLFETKEKCCGCGACMNVCPKHAISMKEDEYGFLYPVIDENLCVECGACKKVCAYQNVIEENDPINSYVAVNVNEQQKLQSASGGVFSALATKILSEGGVVVGAALEKIDGHFVPHHILVEKKEDLIKLQGSKYVQSSTELTYSETLQQLKSGRKVLYSGTPCQIAGLKSFLRVEYDNLITVDLICHGVPNAKMFNEFLNSQAKKLKADSVEHYVFRDKKKGWGMNSRTDYISHGKKKTAYVPARLTSYNSLFLDGFTYRENCYSCKYACKNRPGDFTIGDYWGIEEAHPEIYNKDMFQEKNGISCIIVNTKKGQELLDSTFEDMLYLHDSKYDKVSKRNGQLVSPSQHSPKREKVMETYRLNGYEGIEELYKKAYRKQRMMHWVFNKMPRSMRRMVKSILGK